MAQSPAPNAAAPGGDPPRPMPFAIMRNAHEALRASINLQDRLLAAGDLAGFADEWRDFQRGLSVHMAMEDQGMFDLLDSVSDGAITAAALPAEHQEDMRLLADVETCLADGQISALRQAWDIWKQDHLHHLEHEEEVMMPLTMKTGSTPAERARVVHERILVPSESLPDFDWSIGWVIGKLSREGSASQPAAVATRVYAWGLQHACSPDQWNRLRPIVRDHCTPEIWEELTRDYGLDGEGAISPAV
mgnify:FL=1